MDQDDVAGVPAAARFPLETCFTYRLHGVMKQIDRGTNHAYQQELAMGAGEGRCLAVIGRFAPLSVSELAQRANLDKAQASRCSQVLVDQGLVAKQISTDDARRLVLSLTPAGEAKHREVAALIATRNSEVLACLSAGEQALLGEMLERLSRHLGQLEAGRPDEG